jgi:hypothetical protein
VTETARAAATGVLLENWRGDHTVPAAGLYPHQWSWDSAFIAFGLRHVSPRRARLELETLLGAQWTDGRIPQIVFDPAKGAEYSPGPSFWRSPELPGSSPVATTAGFVQPAVHAWAVLAVHESDPEGSARARFLERAYPRLVAWHAYLTGRRDRGGRGLVSIVHPWEPGTDNSPLWDAVLATVPDTPRDPFDRPDLAHAGDGERPSDRDYGRYYWLAERYRDHDCDDRDEAYPFLVEDPLSNALLARSELALADIAACIGADPAPHRSRAADLTAALDQLWHDDLGIHTAADTRTGDLVPVATVNGLVPLVLPGIRHTGRLVDTLTGPGFLGSGARLVPSTAVTADAYDPRLYWRGPAWFNTSWLVAEGACVQGRPDIAAALRRAIVDLAAPGDHPEYVGPMDGAPHGTRRFSWTAALVLDVLHSDVLHTDVRHGDILHSDVLHSDVRHADAPAAGARA